MRCYGKIGMNILAKTILLLKLLFYIGIKFLRTSWTAKRSNQSILKEIKS